MAAALLNLALLLTLQSPSSPAQASLAGRVIDGDSRAPIAGARVVAVADGSREEVVTDNAGRFVFARLPVGKYRVMADKAGYVTNPAIPPVLAGVVGPTVTVPADGLELRLHKSGVIAGEVVDDRGNPVPAALVHALRRGAKIVPPRSEVPPVLTNDLGEFRVASLRAGEYIVMVTPRGGGPGVGTTTLVPTYYASTSDPQAAFIVTLQPGQTAIGVSITMLSAPVYEITGVVVDEQGRPQSGVAMTLTLQQIGGQSAQSWSRSWTTEDGGRFRIPGLTSGRYRLSAAPQPSTAPSPQKPLESMLARLLATVNEKGPVVSVEIRDESVSGVTLVLRASP